MPFFFTRMKKQPVFSSFQQHCSRHCTEKKGHRKMYGGKKKCSIPWKWFSTRYTPSQSWHALYMSGGFPVCFSCVGVMSDALELRLCFVIVVDQWDEKKTQPRYPPVDDRALVVCIHGHSEENKQGRLFRF